MTLHVLPVRSSQGEGDTRTPVERLSEVFPAAVARRLADAGYDVVGHVDLAVEPTR